MLLNQPCFFSLFCYLYSWLDPQLGSGASVLLRWSLLSIVTLDVLRGRKLGSLHLDLHQVLSPQLALIPQLKCARYFVRFRSRSLSLLAPRASWNIARRNKKIETELEWEKTIIIDIIAACPPVTVSYFNAVTKASSSALKGLFWVRFEFSSESEMLSVRTWTFRLGINKPQGWLPWRL